MDDVAEQLDPDDWAYHQQLARDGAFFGQEAFGRVYVPQQLDVIDALNVPNSKITWRGCHGSGKSQTLIDLAIHFVMRGFTTLTLAPTMRQVRTVLWNRLRAQHKFSKIPLGIEPLKLQWDVSEEVFALGLSANDSTALQGYHGERIFILIDEATGVNADFFAALRGIESGGDIRRAELGNPTSSSGAFYDHCHSPQIYENFQTNAFFTPNILGLFDHPDQPWEEVYDKIAEMDRHDPRLHEPSVLKWAPSRRWLWESIEEWAPKEHPDFEARVLGEFPSQSESALLALNWIDACADRVIEPPKEADWQAGIDVGGGDAETVVYLRHGSKVVDFFATLSPEPHGQIIRWLNDRHGEHIAKRKDGERAKIFVVYDSAGPGLHFAPPLVQAGYPCAGVNVGAAAITKARYRLLKDELYYGVLRERFRQGDIAGITDRKTRAQLASLQWFLNGRGLVEMESKKSQETRGVKSPDRAEAVMLCFMPRHWVQRRIPTVGRL